RIAVPPLDGGRELMRRRTLRPGQHDLDAGLPVQRVDVHVDHEFVARVLAPVQHRRRPGPPDLQPPSRPPGAVSDPGAYLLELGTLGRAAGRGVQAGRPPYAMPADQHVAGPLAGEPATAEPEPARADLRAEPGPV